MKNRLNSDMIKRADKTQVTTTPPSGHDGYCQFELNGRRCAFPGNIAETNRWFCLHHIRHENRGNDSEQHRFFSRFDAMTTHGRECVQDQIADWYKLDDDMPDDPSWHRQQGESATEYNRRMFALTKPLLRGAVKRMKRPLT